MSDNHCNGDCNGDCDNDGETSERPLGLTIDAVSDDELRGWMPVAEADLATLTPAERLAIAHAVPKRQREHAAVRQVARALLERLGHAPVEILNGRGREPIFPTGTVGSLSHSNEIALAVVTSDPEVAGIGCDVEPLLALPAGTERLILTPAEREFAGHRLPLWQGRLIFSLKESFYKAQFPLTRAMPGFDAVQVIVGQDSETLELVTLQDIGQIPAGSVFEGNVTQAKGHMMTRVRIDKCL